uniref:G-patch domain-containing protein n=1 Tax=Anopheles dirus TaxID=7168 RepID=A0A182NPA7_9DIPT
MGGTNKNGKVKPPLSRNKQKKAPHLWKKNKDRVAAAKKLQAAAAQEEKAKQQEQEQLSSDEKAAHVPIVFIKPQPDSDAASGEDPMEAMDAEELEEEAAEPVVPSVEPAPTDIPDPKLSPSKIKMLRPLIGYIYNGDQMSLKQSFEQAGLFLTPDYNEKTRVFRFMVDLKEVCRAVGEKNEAHSVAREKLVQIVRYYCYTVKRVKEYHTRRKIFYTRPPKVAPKVKGQEQEDVKITEDNVGFQMLQKQGWNPGTALGVSTTDGILEPIVAKKRKGKRGLGVEDAEAAAPPTEKVTIPIEAFYLLLKQYAGVNALYDLVFSSQFSRHQVAKLKGFALSLKLLPQMIGQNKKKLVVSRNLTIRQIKEGVMKGHSDLCAKYVVIPPVAGTPETDKVVP